MLNVRHFQVGLQIVGKVTGTSSALGDLEVLTTDNKLRFHNGTSSSPVVTEVHASQGTHRLQNKDLEVDTLALVDAADTTKKVLFDNSAATTGTSTTFATIQTTNRVITIPDADGTLLIGSTPGVIANNVLDEASVWFVDTSDNTKALKFDSSAATTGTSSTIKNSQTVDRIITLPDATDILVGKATTDTLSNKTLDNSTVETIKDSNLTIQNSADISKQAKFSAASISTSTTRTYTLPDASDTLVVLNASQTLTNKTLSGNTASNLINGSGTFNFNSSGTITAPNATDTLVGKATTDILTNKTLSGNTASNLVNGSGTLNINSTGTITVPNATDTLVGQATTDTLTNKTFGDAITQAQISTPSNPSAGFDKLYFKSDDKLYTKNSAGSEQLVGPTSTSGINNYWSGFYGHDEYWQTSLVGTLANFSPQTTITLTQRNGSGITVTKPAGIVSTDTPGIGFTPPTVTATYLITFCGFINNNANQWTLISMTDGSQTMSQLQWQSASNSCFESFSFSALYTPGTTSPVEVVLYGVTAAGTLTLGTPSGDTSYGTALDITIVQLVG